MARRALFQVHLWVGVITGLYIFVVCVSGAALVFRIDMQRAMHPALFTPRTSGPMADPVAIMESVKKAYPAATLSGIDAPTTSRPTYLAYAVSGDRFLTLLLDPVSAEMIGELSDQSFVRTLQDLHFDLLGGRTGRVVNGAGALAPSGDVSDRPRHLVAGPQQLASRFDRGLQTAVEAREQGSAQRRRYLDGAADCDVGGHGRVFRVSVHVPRSGQPYLPSHRSACTGVGPVTLAGVAASHLAIAGR